MTTAREPRYWCGNFDYPDVLDHGLQIDAWLLQYQYEHAGLEYQGNRHLKGRTTMAWKSLGEIQIGDWLIAYLRGNKFFAIGQIAHRRRRKWQAAAIEHLDTIERTVREGCHLYFDGIVRYHDATAFYEDFTDPWNLPPPNRRSGDPAFWSYAQRMNVEAWQHVVPHGVTVSGLATAASFPLYRRPLFSVDADFFARVSQCLQDTCRGF